MTLSYSACEAMEFKSWSILKQVAAPVLLLSNTQLRMARGTNLRTKLPIAAHTTTRQFPLVLRKPGNRTGGPLGNHPRARQRHAHSVGSHSTWQRWTSPTFLQQDQHGTWNTNMSCDSDQNKPTGPLLSNQHSNSNEKGVVQVLLSWSQALPAVRQEVRLSVSTGRWQSQTQQELVLMVWFRPTRKEVSFKNTENSWIFCENGWSLCLGQLGQVNFGQLESTGNTQFQQLSPVHT